MNQKNKSAKFVYTVAAVCLLFGLLMTFNANSSKPMRGSLNTPYDTVYSVGDMGAYQTLSTLANVAYISAALFTAWGYGLQKSAQRMETVKTVTYRGTVVLVAGNMITFELDSGERKQFINDGAIVMKGDAGEIQCKCNHAISFVKTVKVS